MIIMGLKAWRDRGRLGPTAARLPPPRRRRRAASSQLSRGFCGAAVTLSQRRKALVKQERVRRHQDNKSRGLRFAKVVCAP
jgi:hypothetical protein